jgi:hypothetical protein
MEKVSVKQKSKKIWSEYFKVWSEFVAKWLKVE